MKSRALGVVLVVSLLGLVLVAVRVGQRAPAATTGGRSAPSLPKLPPEPTPPSPGLPELEAKAVAPNVAPATGQQQRSFVAPVEAPSSGAGEQDAALRVAGTLPRKLEPLAQGGVEGGVPGGVVGAFVGGPPGVPASVRIGGAAMVRSRSDEFHTEAYDRIEDNRFLAALSNPLSTFSIDVDTASYANVRRFLVQGQLPPKDAVRIEELLNYFRYDYPEPQGETPFSVTTELAACPWRPEHRLLLVGLRGRAIDEAAMPPRRLTFLLDVSGSMQAPDKLPLLKQAMALLVESLREEDELAIVVYAGRSGLVLPPTSGDRKPEIRAALAALEAGGSTAGGAGIELAYRVAAEMREPGAINRVLLATDGDFNVGVTSVGELSRLIEEKRKTGVFLSVLGFGQGNLKDATMEMLADRGNGNYSYIDSEAEARKVLVSEAGATLVTIAKDVKIQVEWNPRLVAGYRLLGYENRVLRAEDFADDRKDAGEIGAGHTLTALYEVVPAGLPLDQPGVDPLKYQRAPALSSASATGELMTLKLRYKLPDGDASRLVTSAVASGGDSGRGSRRLRFAASVAAFGMLLRESEYRGQADWPMVLELGREAGRDDAGYRAEFLELAERAATLAAPRQAHVTR